MFKSIGILRTEPDFMFLECDKGIVKYYRALARTNGIRLVRQRYDSHITVIRTEETTKGVPLSKKYNGVEVEFCCNPEYIQRNSKHYWFRIISPDLETIRMSLGFCSQPIEVLDTGFIHTHPFHLTIGRINI